MQVDHGMLWVDEGGGSAWMSLLAVVSGVRGLGLRIGLKIETYGFTKHVYE